MIDTSWRCRQADFDTEWFRARCAELHEPWRLHRKLWEFVTLSQLAHERLRPGARALGFGVGREPLPAWLAARGVHVLATDQVPSQAQAWAATGQYAGGLLDLRRPDICDAETFARRVAYAYVDMNHLPPDLRRGAYEFLWSACACEHLGSIGHTLDFVCLAMACLTPGGVAIHTTELNVSHPQETLLTGGTVLLRPCDLEDLAQALARQGDRLWPLDLAPGDGEADQYIDRPPYHDAPHLNLQIGPYTSTSVALIIERGGA